MKKTIYLQSLSSLILFASLLLPSHAEAKDILTTTPVTYMLATQLMKGTPITTTYLAPKRYGIERLGHWFATKGEGKVMAEAQQASVVITLRSLWPQDPLFAYARQGNIKIIEVDASQSISPRAKGVATVQLASGNTSLYAWLNPNNLSTMSSIVSDDLKRIWPEQQQIIEKNQQQLLIDIRQLINQQQTTLFDKEIDSVVLLSEQLEDFASANQLFVVDRLFKEELNWTEQDKAQLKALIDESPGVWILTTRKVSARLKQLLPEFERILHVNSIDRWGSKGISLEQPLQSWLF
ncbi:metal ABC transporter solute-binding protein, Zn/Mn family [Psychromonas sp. 14N.309.X.WAT.B.A12]|uniref:metal ABC transporter solute-binding protein, Zn/Mn family n=1 Tax=unclassified Psychromonas TaxID=2614957 RepID=UPI0025B042C0|nr:zinc ABC transporter substrate-binding protein [Psychromonas sp. 14N.309.X.WAT.B.A12]MDN2663314.1 ABC transporter substrate-binding protein [Psychromonas sp. 14N.309.X.WAT.B.A12]